MGLTWAIAWAGFGVLIGASSLLLPWLPWDRFFALYDAPLPTLAIPGFLGGALFSVVLGIAARRRSFHDLSLPRFAAWGALGGVLVSLVPAAMVGLGLATLRPGLDVWSLTAAIGVPLTLLSAASASVSLAVARRGADREAIGAGGGPDDAARLSATLNRERAPVPSDASGSPRS